MTMYLPNPDLGPTGYEPAEPATEPGDRRPARTERRVDAVVHLDVQTRLDIAHWAEEYIAGLVENHHGDREDVRAVVRDLHDRINLIDANGDTSR